MALFTPAALPSMDCILEGLNAAQEAAVTSPSHILQILAPPGSGKTKTLTSRVAYTIQTYKFKAWNIICLTFTIKSSREMKERVAKLLGNGIVSRLVLGTFHSVCRRYLVTYGHLIGISKDFGIADASDTLNIIRRIIKRHRLNIDPKKAQARISYSKSKGIGYTKLTQEKIQRQSIDQQEFFTVFEDYEDQLARSNLLDYDDLLLHCVVLLQCHPSCVSNVEAVFIDEFQDTNVVQFELMKLFAAQNNRVTTVGDPDQSIYGWRSAEVKNLQKMQRQYPDVLVIHLEENYRSSGAILLSAHEVIEQDQSRPQSSLMPTHCPGTVPVLRRLPSAEIEAAWIVAEIERTMGLTGNLLVYSDFAILLRSAFLSRLLETAIGKAGIPYRMVGGHRFYDRAEIKILLDYLRVVSQPSNNDALSRIINVPPRGIGPETIKKLLEEAEVKCMTLWQMIRDAVRGHVKTATKISKAAEHGIGTLTNIILSARCRMSDSVNPSSPENLLIYIIHRLNFNSYVKKAHIEDHEARWANVEELVAQSAEYPVTRPAEERDSFLSDEDALPSIEGLSQASGNAAEEALSKFLANVALATELQREDQEDTGTKPRSQITISTIHAAKGLEWPVVFVPSAYDGSIPHSRAEDTDEERRLLYVAMTRAQALLYLSCPTRNSHNEATTLSPFLSEKRVQHLLSNRGPNIGTNEIVDVARILRRDCPSKNEIFETSKYLHRWEDNLWPLDGEEQAEATKIRWTKRNETIEQSGPNFKRRRLMNDAYDSSAEAQATVRVGLTTTMQNAYSFSYNNHGAFSTAAAQLHWLQQKQGKPIEHDYKALKRARPVKAAPEQENLLHLWGMKRQPDDTISVTAPIAHKVTGTRELRDEARVVGYINSATPPKHHARLPLSTLSEPLATHNLQLASAIDHPSQPPVDGDDASKQYVFLSSSPPPSDGLPENAKEEPSEVAREPLVDARRVERRQALDAGPRRAFQATSMTQTPGTSSNRWKTLGVRRSMSGWPGGGGQGFSVPRKLNTQPRFSDLRRCADEKK